MKYGQKNIPHFKGVFPLDKIPNHLIPPANFIINTDTHNLPGTHWIAISYQRRGIVHVFDPLGLYYPYLLANSLQKYGRTRFNKIMYQDPRTATCGQHCLDWLSKQV